MSFTEWFIRAVIFAIVTSAVYFVLVYKLDVAYPMLSMSIWSALAWDTIKGE